MGSNKLSTLTLFESKIYLMHYLIIYELKKLSTVPNVKTDHPDKMTDVRAVRRLTDPQARVGRPQETGMPGPALKATNSILISGTEPTIDENAIGQR